MCLTAGSGGAPLICNSVSVELSTTAFHGAIVSISYAISMTAVNTVGNASAAVVFGMPSFGA